MALLDIFKKRVFADSHSHVSSDKYPMIDIFSWKPSDGRLNFGDTLADVIVDNVLATCGQSRFSEVSSARTLLSVGSVLHFGDDDTVVWGSGVNGKIPNDMYRFKRLDVRAVRGPMTAEWLRKKGIDSPEIYGDPALLIPHLFKNEFRREIENDHCFVPNFHDLLNYQHELNLISPYMGWNRVISEILKSRLVIASSLHGLIIADAYGIPSRYVRLSGHEDMFKYRDYFLGVGRDDFEFATSIPQALEMGGMNPISYDPTALLGSFPLDLWKSGS